MGLDRPPQPEDDPSPYPFIDSASEWDHIASLGFDAVWLMGVWERSPGGITISMVDESLVSGFRGDLPDFTARDNVGSPYCVRRHAVDRPLGGSEALAIDGNKLTDRGLRLILDFVLNHVAPDHHRVAVIEGHE